VSVPVENLCSDLPDTSIVLQDIMDIKLVKCKERSVWLRVDEDSLLPHNVRDCGVKVEAGRQAVNDILSGQVVTISRNEAVIGEGVHHRARSTDCIAS